MRRRQARRTGVRGERHVSALQVWLWLLVFLSQNEFRLSTSIQPGYLDFDNLPDTNFTCIGKVIGGYYADLEASCQMFHVCTVGAQDEPMDIKFLCLNGTVFDQETRVCERVDEVDCTNSEKFYSLNLELYGSTIKPPVTSQTNKPNENTNDQSSEQTEANNEPDPSLDRNAPTKTDTPNQTLDPPDATDESTMQETSEKIPEQPTKILSNVGPKHTETSKQHVYHESTSNKYIEPEEEEVEEEDSDNDDEYEFYHVPKTTTVQPTTTMKPTTSSTTTTTVEPALLSPQEFIYRHRGQNSEAVSFQRQSYQRPADAVYITHAPAPSSFQYESARTAPRPSPFAPRPSSSHINRPGPASQPSERYETRQRRPNVASPPAFEYQYRYDVSTHSPLLARAAPPLKPTIASHPPSSSIPSPFVPSSFSTKPTSQAYLPPPTSTASRTALKSPPRVIVTASASVSDSNGKKLNYTVGNVVKAVKPIVPVNYDDYKETDLIFDPFFLDVPKLKRRNRQTSVTKPPAAWSVLDYVDDNYEPETYMDSVPPPPLPIVHEVARKFRRRRNSRGDI